MAHMQPLFLKNEKLARSQYPSLSAYLLVTGAKTNSDANYPYPAPILFGYDNTDLTQAKVEAFLGHTSQIVCTTAFGSTAMGTDVLGFVIDMGGKIQVSGPNAGLSGNGQAATVSLVEASLVLSGSGYSSLVQRVADPLPNTLPGAVAVSPDGDIYGHVVLTGLDAATSGYVKLTWFFSAT